MNQNDPENREGVSKLSRRGLLALGATLAGTSSLGLFSEKAAAHELTSFRDAFIGNDSDKSGLGSKGWLFFAKDSGSLYHHDGTGWNELPIGGELTDTDGDNLLEAPNHGGLDIEELTATSVKTDQLHGAESDVNYANPSWLALTSAINYHTFFESIDGYQKTTSGSGKISLLEKRVHLDTGTTSGSTVEIRDSLQASRGGYSNPTWTKPRILASGITIRDAATDVQAYICQGTPHLGNPGVGIKVENGDLLAVTHDGSLEYTTVLIDNVGTGHHRFLVKHDPNNDEARFWVDQVGDSGTPDATIYPTAAGNRADIPFTAYVENTAGVQRRITTSEFRFVQEP